MAEEHSEMPIACLDEPALDSGGVCLLALVRTRFWPSP